MSFGLVAIGVPHVVSRGCTTRARTNAQCRLRICGRSYVLRPFTRAVLPAGAWSVASGGLSVERLLARPWPLVCTVVLNPTHAARVCMHPCMYVCVRARACARTHTYIYAYTRPALAHKVSRPRGTGSVGDSVGEGPRPCTHLLTHTYMHTYLNTYTRFQNMPLHSLNGL